MKKAMPPKVQKFPTAKQRRLDRLLEKNSEGTITPKEKTALAQLVAEAELWMVANGRRLAEFSKREAVPPSARAVPVTVWIRPQDAER